MCKSTGARTAVVGCNGYNFAKHLVSENPIGEVMSSTVVPEKVNLAESFQRIEEHWRPKIVGELNGQEVKLVKFQGSFVWHHHEDGDELFLGVRGRFCVEFRDREVEIGPGEMLVVPRGVEHRTRAEEEVEVLLFEPAAMRNTGNVDHSTLTAPMGGRL